MARKKRNFVFYILIIPIHIMVKLGGKKAILFLHNLFSKILTGTMNLEVEDDDDLRTIRIQKFGPKPVEDTYLDELPVWVQINYCRTNFGWELTHPSIEKFRLISTLDIDRRHTHIIVHGYIRFKTKNDLMLWKLANTPKD